MFGVDEVRVFSGHEVKFECRCSRERVANVLRSLGVEEVRIGDRGAGRVHGDLRVLPEALQVRAIDVEQLFDRGAPRGSDAIN